ncbi:MAG TPA: aminotransferase class III-fold pyridoxal phosphate-dependent enzyme [Candidatus Omnitrophica bacterium]|nr:aminotransferase class III-fold pyridoxal phosphate-dependent enzyme [Candidatus Omnitrophota bacterium]
MTGFRIKLGGAQEYFGVTPDLSTFGKAVGGGVPLAGYGGRSDIMELVSQKKCVEGGTYNTNSLAVAAGLVTLSELEKKGTYERLTNLGKRLMTGMREMAERYTIPLEVQGPGPMFGIRFATKNAVDARTALESHYPGIYPGFRRLLLEGGVHIFPTEKGEITKITPKLGAHFHLIFNQ